MQQTCHAEPQRHCYGWLHEKYKFTGSLLCWKEKNTGCHRSNFEFAVTLEQPLKVVSLSTFHHMTDSWNTYFNEWDHNNILDCFLGTILTEENMLLEFLAE